MALKIHVMVFEVMTVCSLGGTYCFRRIRNATLKTEIYVPPYDKQYAAIFFFLLALTLMFLFH
jgi:hypothetical protein